MTVPLCPPFCDLGSLNRRAQILLGERVPERLDLVRPVLSLGQSECWKIVNESEKHEKVSYSSLMHCTNHKLTSSTST